MAAPALGHLGFLASHRGTNVQAVLDACKTGRLGARPAVVIGNNRDAEVLARARRVGATGLPFERGDPPRARGAGSDHPRYAHPPRRRPRGPRRLHEEARSRDPGPVRRTGHQHPPRPLAALRGIGDVWHAGPRGGTRFRGDARPASRSISSMGIMTGARSSPSAGYRSSRAIAPGPWPPACSAREHAFLVETLERILAGELVLPGHRPFSVAPAR